MRFLFIDDDLQFGTVISRIAENCGFEVLVSTQGAEFKAAYESFHPDVIGLDLCIPDCDGVELMRYLAGMGCRAPILIVSGMDNKVLASAKALGLRRGLKITGVISKPMHVTEVRALFDSIRETAGHHG